MQRLKNKLQEEHEEQLYLRIIFVLMAFLVLTILIAFLTLKNENKYNEKMKELNEQVENEIKI